MRLLVISDIHGASVKYDELIERTEPDVIILPGDIPSSIDIPTLFISAFQRGNRGGYIKNFYQRFINRANIRQIKTTKLILNDLIRFNIPVLFIHGNTETSQTRSWMRLYAIRNPNLHYIADNYVKIEDHLFMGMGWTPYSDNSRQKTPGDLDDDYISSILLDIYGRVDKSTHRKFLISHSPPYGTEIDYLPHKRYHAGSKSVRSLLETQSVEAVISGHLHEASGSVTRERWWGINAGAAVEDRACLVDTSKREIHWYCKIIRNPSIETVIYQVRNRANYDKR